MSTTKYIETENHHLSITQYYSGTAKAKRLQIEDADSDSFISEITPDEAKALGEALILWSREGL